MRYSINYVVLPLKKLFITSFYILHIVPNFLESVF